MALYLNRISYPTDFVNLTWAETHWWQRPLFQKWWVVKWEKHRMTPVLVRRDPQPNNCHLSLQYHHVTTRCQQHTTQHQTALIFDLLHSEMSSSIAKKGLKHLYVYIGYIGTSMNKVEYPGVRIKKEKTLKCTHITKTYRHFFHFIFPPLLYSIVSIQM